MGKDHFLQLQEMHWCVHTKLPTYIKWMPNRQWYIYSFVHFSLQASYADKSQSELRIFFLAYFVLISTKINIFNKHWWDDVSGDSKLRTERSKQKVKEIPFYKYIRNVEEIGGKVIYEYKSCLLFMCGHAWMFSHIYEN